MNCTVREFTIMLVEDDENDILLVQRALHKNGINNPVHVSKDGEDAIDFLREVSKAGMAGPTPRLIFLDIKLPKKNGLEVLAWIKRHPTCSLLPTIVLSSSRQEKDVIEAYRRGANSFIVKPAKFEDLQQMIKTTYEYWCWCEKPPVDT